jgi:hypothetical protein
MHGAQVHFLLAGFHPISDSLTMFHTPCPLESQDVDLDMHPVLAVQSASLASMAAKEREDILGVHARVFCGQGGELRTLALAPRPEDTLWAACMVNSRCFSETVSALCMLRSAFLCHGAPAVLLWVCGWLDSAAADCSLAAGARGYRGSHAWVARRWLHLSFQNWCSGIASCLCGHTM